MNKQILIIMGLLLLLAGGFFFANSYMDKESDKEVNQMQHDPANIKTIDLEVEGMTCDGCANSIEKAVVAKEGIISADASFEKGNAIIKFDHTLINTDLIESIIGEAGYQVIGIN